MTGSSDSRQPRIPNLFLIGAGKSGTTALWHYLREHPHVFMTYPKELHYFGSDFPVPPGLPTTLEEYLAYFDPAANEPVVGEASTSYLFSTSAAREIHDFNRNAKIVAIIRNPVDVMHSLHSMYVQTMVEDIGDFEEALAAQEQPDRLERVPPWRRYREVVRFSDQLQRYLDLFDRHRIHLIVYDDLKQDPSATYQRLLGFLEIDDSFEPQYLVANANKKVRSRSFKRMIQNPPGPLRSMARAMVPSRTRAAIGHRLDRLNTVHVARPPMAAETRRALVEELAAEVSRLEAIMDRDLSQWRR